jgi:hypothetical protein
MNSNKPLSRYYLARMASDDRRAAEAKRRYAEERGLNPITLKPLG